jgi:initiation factor 1A
MVRNVTGGKKAKQSGHKAFTPSRMKISTDPSECYAIVTKMTGGRICLVKCQDKEERLCHIRGAFSGKFKGGNFIKAGVWVLVGLREWASKTEGKQECCDLLYVYTDREKETLIQSTPNLTILQQQDQAQKDFKDDEMGILMSEDAEPLDFDEI